MPKLRSLLLSVIALFITLFVTNDYLHAGFPYTHDGENHLARFANYKVAIKEGQIPPRFAPNLINHYGYPVFNYNYPLANILSVPLSVAGFEYETAFKILVLGFVWMGLLGIGHWLTTLNFNTNSTVLGMIAYGLSPYLITSLIFRGNIGEIAALGLYPWLLHAVEKIRKDTTLQLSWDWLLTAVPTIGIFTAFLLSHNVTVLFGVPLLLIYALFRLQLKKKSWLQLGLVVILAVGLSLWFWLPAVMEKSLVVVDNAALSSQFFNHFSTFKQLFIAPFHFGFSYPGSIDSLSFSFGLLQTACLCISLFAIVKKIGAKNLTKKDILFTAVVLLALSMLVFQLPLTKPIWQALPLARFIQFPWRLGIFLSIVVAPISAYAWRFLAKPGKFLLCLLILIQSVAFIKAKPVGYFHKADVEYDLFAQSTTTANENLPKTFTYLLTGDWQPAPLIKEGFGTIDILRWTGSDRSYVVTVDQPSTIIEPTMNFAGWETLITPEGRSSPTRATYNNDDQIAGRLAYTLAPGTYTVRSQFTQRTVPRVVGNTISLVVALGLLYCVGKRILPKTVHFFILWKIGLGVTAVAAASVLIYKPSFPYADTLLAPTKLPAAIYSWANFDGVHYLTIAEKGYKGTGLIQAFFPLFPELVSITPGGNTQRIVVGLALNTVFSFLLLLVWRKLLLLDYNAKVSWLSVLALFLFPTAFFLQAFYTEALFLLLVVLCFYCARKQRWFLAGMCAAIASATRIVGIALVPALLFELWQQYPQLKNHLKSMLFVIFGSVGLLGYMGYLWTTFGDPLYFLHVQEEFGSGRSESLVLFPQVVWRYIKIILTYRPIDLKYFAFVQELVVSILGALTLGFAWFRIRKSYVIFSGLVFLIPTLTGTFTSMPRYILASFVIFIVLGKLLSRHQSMQVIYFTISTMLLIFNTILFIQGYWIA